MFEQDTHKIYEQNLKHCLRMLKRRKSPEYTLVRKRLFSKLAIFYKSINANFEGSKTRDSKVNYL